MISICMCLDVRKIVLSWLFFFGQNFINLRDVHSMNGRIGHLSYKGSFNTVIKFECGADATLNQTKSDN